MAHGEENEDADEGSRSRNLHHRHPGRQNLDARKVQCHAHRRR